MTRGKVSRAVALALVSSAFGLEAAQALGHGLQATQPGLSGIHDDSSSRNASDDRSVLQLHPIETTLATVGVNTRPSTLLSTSVTPGIGSVSTSTSSLHMTAANTLSLPSATKGSTSAGSASYKLGAITMMTGLAVAASFTL